MTNFMFLIFNVRCSSFARVNLATDTQLMLSATAAAIDLLGYLLWQSKGAIIDKTTIALSRLSTQKPQDLILSLKINEQGLNLLFS